MSAASNGQKGEATAYHPFRFSELIVNSKGHRRLMVRAANPDPNGPDLSALMAAGNVIKPTEIADWFKRLRFSPTDSDLDELASYLNKIRVTKPREEAVPNPPELQQVAEALSLLSANVPVLIEMQRTAISLAGPNAVARDIARRIKLITNLEASLLAARVLLKDTLMNPKGPARRKALWHRDLEGLAFLLERLAEKHGKKAMSLTKAEGPAVEWLRQALARVGIHQDRSTIAKAMARLKERTLSVFDEP